MSNINVNHINPKKKYLLAVSGGIDSVVMLDVFRKAGLSCSVVHCNFQLRGEDSNLDEDLVRQLALKHEIPFYCRQFETEKISAEKGWSIQETARNLRYTYFAELMEQCGLDFVATAHHADDNIETLLFHFFRGTGMKGLTGIAEENGKIIRPLLSFTRTEIEEYAAQHHLAYRQDASNVKTIYTRNKIRLEVIPYLQKIFPTLNENMLDNLARFKEIHAIYQKEIDKQKNKLLDKRGVDYYLPIRKLKHMVAEQTIIFECLQDFGFSIEQTRQVLAMKEAQSGHYITSQTHKVIKDRDFFIITPLQTQETEILFIENGVDKIETRDFSLDIQFKQAEGFIIQRDPQQCSIDAASLEEPLRLRLWKQGDYFYPFGMTKKKKVARLLIDEKIPLHQKEKIWVLESNQKIVWVVGVRADNRFRIKPSTKQVAVFKVDYK